MYGPKNQLGERALGAVLKFNPLASGRSEPESSGGLSEGDFVYAVEKGWPFRPNCEHLDHATAKWQRDSLGRPLRQEL